MVSDKEYITLIKGAAGASARKGETNGIQNNTDNNCVCLMFLSAVLCCQMSAIHNPLKIRDTYSFDYEFSDDPPKLPIAGTVFPVPHTL